MEKDIDPETIKATQNSLGKYVKRPPLSEKLLKKPPFRFLHDIVTTTLKTTGFFDGLFDEGELISENVKDRESKIQFLNKVIAVLGTTTGKSIAAKPSKIVAGQEPEKTNELLQCLAFALEKKLTSHDAVKIYKDGTGKPAAPEKTEKKTKEKEPTKVLKKPAEDKRFNSKSSEKLTSQKKEPKERQKNEKNNTISNKAKLVKADSKESVSKKDSPPKQNKQLKSNVKEPETQKATKDKSKVSKEINEKVTIGQNNIKEDSLNTAKVNRNGDLSQHDKDAKHEEDIGDNTANNESRGELNTSYVIAPTDLNSSLSSQDLMEVETNRVEGEQNSLENKVISEVTLPKQHSTEKPISNQRRNENEEKIHKSRENSTEQIDNSKRIVSKQSSIPKDDKYSVGDPVKDKEDTRPVRPVSVRPSSSRPGAPRLRDKHESVAAGNETLIVGKVNIIQETNTIEEEEDTSIVIVDSKDDEAQDDALKLTSNQHGHLVQQILESSKEFSQSKGKTEIEWQFDALKSREAASEEVDKIKVNIQALSRVANPLGKLLDHIQEDVEVMRQELQQWMKTYEETSKELLKHKTANDESLLPLHSKIKQLEADVEEKRERSNDLKVIIHKNASRIDKLLASGNVQ